MNKIEAVVSDFGGVLSTPLLDAFVAYEQHSGIPLEQLGKAMTVVGEDHGSNLLVELETGRITAAEFLTSVAGQLTVQLGREVTMDGFGEYYFQHLHPNQPVIDYMRELKTRGYKLAICTNNVREWDQLWRCKLPVDEIFDHVIDSGFVGVRKPEPAIYELTLTALGTRPEATVLLDDVEHNCTAARELGMQAVWFRSNEQALAELDELLSGR
jgi:putative hydrolase of the HAD superfamily